MHRQELLERLRSYRTSFVEECAHAARTRAFVERHEDCFERALLSGHVTGSAWVVSPDLDRVLLLHHRKHDQWFQPGGHADGDPDVVRVALRETLEETGLEPVHVRLIDDSIFDIDVHDVPGIADVPRHLHYDVRFLVEADDRVPVPGNDESHQVIWANLFEVPRFNNNRSTFRMIEKTRRLRNRGP